MTRIKELLDCLKFEPEYDYQKQTIARALKLFDKGKKGIILGDEVGMGKTYEALGLTTLYLLGKNIIMKPRVLIIVPPNLRSQKWNEEIKPDGFLRYLDKEKNDGLEKIYNHFLNKTSLIENKRQLVEELKPSNFETGIFIISPTLFFDQEKDFKRRLKTILGTQWHVIIVDEAHRYCRGNKQSEKVRVLIKNAPSTCKIILCTATPFQIETNELIDLIGMFDKSRLDVLESLINRYDSAFEEFKKQLNEQSFEAILAEKEKLELLLKHYIIRNRRDSQSVRKAHQNYIESLPPEFKLAYLNMHRTISEYSVEGNRTFIPTVRQLTLSSYQALNKSKGFKNILKSTGNSIPNAKIIKRIAENDYEHPKEKELIQLIGKWVNDGDFHKKWLIFVNHIETVHEILKKLDDKHSSLLEQIINLSLKKKIESKLKLFGLGSGTYFSNKYYYEYFASEDNLKNELRKICDDEDIWNSFFKPYYDKELRYAKTPTSRLLINALFDATKSKFEEISLKFDIIEEISCRCNSKKDFKMSNHDIVEEYLEKIVLTKVKEIFKNYGTQKKLIKRELNNLINSLYPKKVVQGLTGETKNKEWITKSFNQKYNPLILIATRVAEEGIDLQKYCCNVVHYDHEWNPARIEQREGRVDRKGRNDKTLPIDIYSLLMKGTYDEKIYNWYNKRKEWHELYLCSSFTKEFGEIDDPNLFIDVEEDNEITEESIVNEKLKNKLNELHLNLSP